MHSDFLKFWSECRIEGMKTATLVYPKYNLRRKARSISKGDIMTAALELHDEVKAFESRLTLCNPCPV